MELSRLDYAILKLLYSKDCDPFLEYDSPGDHRPDKNGKSVNGAADVSSHRLGICHQRM